LDSIDEQLIVQPALLSYHLLTSRRGLPRLSSSNANGLASSLLATPISATSSRTNSPAATSTATGSTSAPLLRATSDDNTTSNNNSNSTAAAAARLRHSRSMSAFLPASQTATSSTRSGANGVDRDWNAEYQDIYSMLLHTPRSHHCVI
jgi:hypothetical protein